MYFCARLHDMTKLNRYICILSVLFIPLSLGAQEESTSVFNFLTLPSSSHAMALGGPNVSIPDDDASLLFMNPALMANVSDKSINLSFLTYMRGCKVGDASFIKAHGERGSWGVGAQFVGYGKMRETTLEGVEIGDFGALDLLLTGGYSYLLSRHWAGGVTGKFIYSKYAEFTSIGLAADLGLNYFDENHDFSASVVAANLGGQVKSFGDHHERVPFDLRAGFSKRLAEAPIRFSVTMVNLTRWSSRYFYNPERDEKFGKILMNHFVVGVDILPADMFYVSAGFNFRRASEMKAAGSSRGAGLSFGAGLNVKKIKVGVSYAKYHVSAPSLMLTAQYAL